MCNPVVGSISPCARAVWPCGLHVGDGNLIGKSNDNPILDTREYIVEFPDGREAEYAANQIAVNMIARDV